MASLFEVRLIILKYQARIALSNSDSLAAKTALDKVSSYLCTLVTEG